MNSIRTISEKNTRKIQDHAFYRYRLEFLVAHRNVDNSMSVKFHNLKHKIKDKDYKAVITIYNKEPDRCKRIIRGKFKYMPVSVYHIKRIHRTDRDMYRKTIYCKSKRRVPTKTLQELAHGD